MPKTLINTTSFSLGQIWSILKLTEVHDGSVAFDIKGRLGSIRIPKRMIISDYELKVGQEVAFNMSFIEQISADVNEHYKK